MNTRRINLISGPRNISTALMYSFANREDTQVVDEPMYAYYLKHTKIKYHPGTEQILASLPEDIEEVKENLLFQPCDKPIYFIKGMAHHYIDLQLDFVLDLENVFLIRNPYQLITSFSKVIEQPTLQDIGLKLEWDICEFIIQNGKTPIVIDSNQVLNNPEEILSELCSKLLIPFSQKMLRWSAGPLNQDGVWAKYWYKNVWKSTGFAKQKSSSDKLPIHLNSLYEESLDYYNRLKKYAINAG